MSQFKKYLDIIQESVIINGKEHETFNFNSDFYKTNSGKPSISLEKKIKYEIKISKEDWEILKQSNYSITEPIRNSFIKIGEASLQVRSLSDINQKMR